MTSELPTPLRSKVSILVPAYNAAPWIRQCLDSAMTQTWPNTEVIVVDDGSSDATAQIVRSYGSRLQLVEAKHAGGNAARNTLLNLARGTWLQYLDADDYLLPHKISDQMQRLEETPDLDLIYSPVILRDERKGSEQPLLMDPAADLPLHYIRWGELNTNGFLWRRSSMAAAGGWKPDQPACQEHELLLRMMKGGTRFSLVNRPGAVYRIHETASVSRRDPLRTVRLQMELLDRLQDQLARRGEMTVNHRKALFSARMGAARTAWKTDPALARTLAKQAKSTGVWWINGSAALPMSFQMTVRLLGYANAERLAEWQRTKARA